MLHTAKENDKHVLHERDKCIEKTLQADVENVSKWLVIKG